MPPRRVRRLGALALAGCVAVGTMAGCGGGDDREGSDGADRTGAPSVRRDGDELTIEGGEGSVSLGKARIPDDFPRSEVPLPDAGNLSAVVDGSARDPFYSLTYAVASADLESVADDYRDALRDADYRIEESSAEGDSAAPFRAFTAIGDEWDVIVYGGGAADAGAALSLQVTPHDEARDVPGGGDGTGAQVGG